MIQKGNYYTCDRDMCFSVDASFTCAHASHNDVVLEIVETPKEKQLNALGQIAMDRQRWYYIRIQRQKEYEFVCEFLTEVQASLPKPTGGALMVSGSMNLGGAVPHHLQIWPAFGIPSY